jgi:hypothetical protein
MRERKQPWESKLAEGWDSVLAEGAHGKEVDQ